MKITPSGLCTDDEFLRRIYLDLTGLPPTAEQVNAFLNDSRETRIKRDAIVDQLIGNPEFVSHWSNKWADLMQVNRKYLGTEGSKGLRDWIKEQVKQNRPYNEFAYELLTASGSNRENPAAAYYKIHRTPEEAMENTTHLFLATRFNCNKCHDHPFERWTQDQYYEMAAFFAQVDRKKDPASGDKRISGSAVEGAKPLYEIAAAKSSHDAYVANNGGNLQRWRTRQLNQNQWHPLLFSEFESKNTTPFTIRADRSVLLQPKTGKDTYIAVAQTDLTGITAIRLELLHDSSLPAGGPGLAENGNLVLSEFEMFVAHPDRPNDWQKIELTTPLANTSQDGFSIDQTIDGKPANNKGWALVNAVGKTSWATFQLKLPIGYSHGTLVRFKMHQKFDDNHQVGCFRISLSKFHEPVGLGLSEALLAELSGLKSGEDEKTDAKFLDLATRDDMELKRLQANLEQAEKPLIIDPAIVKLQEKLARVSKPIPMDVLLSQLEKDVVVSASQLENSRLTAAQDLTWALINSPSFLFNR